MEMVAEGSNPSADENGANSGAFDSEKNSC
jgi:hypothetical protein